MQSRYSNVKRHLPVLLVGLFAMLLTSCGSYYHAGYEDGIYASRNGSTANTAAVETENEADKANYYKQYFQSKGSTFEEVPEEGAIFTDIDAYSTTERVDEDGYIIVEPNQGYNDGYGAWGTNGGEVTVNIYDNGFNNWGWGWGGGFGIGWGAGWGYSPLWYWGPWRPWGWGIGGWGLGWGWGSPWGIGNFGFGWGYPGFGGAFCAPFYGGYGYYNTVAFNRGRRNLDYIAGRSVNRGRNSGTYSRDEINRRIASRGRPSNSRGNYARPSNSRPNGYSRPSNSRPNSYSRPSNSRPSNSRPSYNRPSNSRPSYSRPSNSRPSYSRPSGGSRPSVSRPSSGSRGGFSRGGGSRGGGSRGGRGRG